MVRAIENEKSEKSMLKAVKNVTFGSARVQIVVYIVSALLTASDSYCGSPS